MSKHFEDTDERKIPLFDMEFPSEGKIQEPVVMLRTQAKIAKLVEKIYCRMDEGPLILVQAKAIGFLVEESKENPACSGNYWIRMALIRVLKEEEL